MTEDFDDTAQERARNSPPGLRLLFDGMAATICLLAMFWALDGPRWIGLILFVQQYMIVAFGIALALVFLIFPARRKKTNSKPERPSAVDAIAALFSVAVCIWLSIRYPVLSEDVFFHINEAFIICAIALVLILDGLRRTVGWPLLSVALAFIAYAFGGHLIPGILNGLYVQYDFLIAYLIIDPNALVGVPLIVGSTIVIAFVFFGQILRHTGGSGFFTDLAIGLMGSFRGGAAKIAIVASSLFGSISGSAVSNVVSTGIITIPLMRRGGYSAIQAGAIEAVASTGGQLMPPVMGAAAFLMAETIQVPYRDVVLAALIPALLYYLTVFVQSDLDAARSGARPVPIEERPRLWETITSGWHFLAPFVILVLALFQFNLPPERAALYAALAPLLTGMVFGYRGRRMPLIGLWHSVRDTGYAVLDLLMIVAVAGIVIGVLNISGLGFSLTRILVLLGGESVFLLLLITAGVGIVLGMGMPTVGVYVLLSVLVAPALVEAGFQPMAAHMFVLYFGLLSMITPPIALAAFTAASLAKADPMRTGFTAIRYGWSAYIIPFIFLFSPELLFQGSGPQIAMTTLRAGLAVWLISLATTGYFRQRLTAPWRIVFAISGTCLLVPQAALPDGAIWVNAAGLAIALIAAKRNWQAG